VLAARSSAGAFNVTLKSVENGLPSFPLLLDGVSFLAVESDPNRYAGLTFAEFDSSLAISEGIFEEAVGHHIRIGARKVEAKAAVPCFHA